MLDEHGFGYHGTRAAGTGHSGDRHQQVQNKNGEIAHAVIVSRSHNLKKRSRILQFATHMGIQRGSACESADGTGVAETRVNTRDAELSESYRHGKWCVTPPATLQTSQLEPNNARL